MGIFRDKKKKQDDQIWYSSDYSSCSSSFSSSDTSSSSDESDESIFFSSSSQRRRNNSLLQDDIKYVEGSFFQLPSLIRRRIRRAGSFLHVSEEGRRSRRNRDNERKYEYDTEFVRSSSDDSSSSKSRKRRSRGGKERNFYSSFHWSSSLLAISLLIWCGVQIATTEYLQNQSLNLIHNGIDRPQGHVYYHRIFRDGNSRPHERSPPHLPPSTKKKDSLSKKEMLQPGCELDPAWQTPESNSKLLSCQLLHELDLSDVLSVSSESDSSKRRRSLSSSAHVGSGFWRDVWKIRDNTLLTHNSTRDESNFVVLKTMKVEHEVIHRNFERHRREAATMSRLTKSPHVTNLYAYCGNSIVTEFAAMDLSHSLNTKTRRDTNANHNERRRKIKDINRARRAKELQEPERHLTSNGNTNSSIDDVRSDLHTNRQNIRSDISPKFSTSSSLSSSLSTTLPLTTRIDLALQASKAIADMHRSDVIHADITTKQFLIISTTGGSNGGGNINSKINVQVKINDFNRCRFVPRRQKPEGNQTSTKLANVANTKISSLDKSDRCTIRIPSAPGLYRSPEEYSDKALTPQMDVFSLGHVLYEIWTNGQTPWYDVGGRRFKNIVMDGALPNELKNFEYWYSQSERQHAGNVSNPRNDDFLLAENEGAFGRLIRKCYTVDPERRITADALVQSLTKLLESVRNQKSV